MDLMKKEYQMEFSSANDSREKEEDDDSIFEREESFSEIHTLERTESQTLHNAFEKRDLVAARLFHNTYTNVTKAILSENGSTVLHATTVAGQLKIVKAVVKKISITETEIKDSAGERALYYASDFGMIEIAKCLVRNAGNLLIEISSDIWLVVACRSCHKEVTHYLYSVTPFNLLHLGTENQGYNFLQLCPIDTIFALWCLPEHSWFFPHQILAFWQQWIYNCIKQIYDLKLTHHCASEIVPISYTLQLLALGFQLTRISAIALQMQRDVQ